MPYVNPDGCRSLCMALPNVRLCCQMWAPPTPPQDDHDLYIDQSVCFLYEPSVMPESQLPPVYVKKEHKRIRVDPAMSKSTTHAMVLVLMTSSKASFVYCHFSVFFVILTLIVKFYLQNYTAFLHNHNTRQYMGDQQCCHLVQFNISKNK